MNRKNKDGIIYSTNSNHRYDVTPHQTATILPGQQKLRVVIDKKQRAGKSVTLITGFSGKEEELEKLGRELKSKCGVGGSVKDGEIIIQGEHKDRIIQLLTKMGYGVKP